jgi:hypothetical protein
MSIIESALRTFYSAVQGFQMLANVTPRDPSVQITNRKALSGTQNRLPFGYHGADFLRRRFEVALRKADSLLANLTELRSLIREVD